MNRIKITKVSETEYMLRDEESCIGEIYITIEQMRLLVTDIEEVLNELTNNK